MVQPHGVSSRTRSQGDPVLKRVPRPRVTTIPWATEAAVWSDTVAIPEVVAMVGPAELPVRWHQILAAATATSSCSVGRILPSGKRAHARPCRHVPRPSARRRREGRSGRERPTGLQSRMRPRGAGRRPGPRPGLARTRVCHGAKPEFSHFPRARPPSPEEAWRRDVYGTIQFLVSDPKRLSLPRLSSPMATGRGRGLTAFC